MAHSLGNFPLEPTKNLNFNTYANVGFLSGLLRPSSLLSSRWVVSEGVCHAQWWDFLIFHISIFTNNVHIVYRMVILVTCTLGNSTTWTICIFTLFILDSIDLIIIVFECIPILLGVHSIDF